jgi:hypothetical protein
MKSGSYTESITYNSDVDCDRHCSCDNVIHNKRKLKNKIKITKTNKIRENRFLTSTMVILKILNITMNVVALVILP